MNKSIIRYSAKQLITGLITLFILNAIVFAVIRLSPGTPYDKYLSPEFSNELRTEIEKKFSLNESLSKQYYNYLKQTLTLDLGTSFTYKKSVSDIINSKLGNTVLLAVTTFLLQLLLTFAFIMFTYYSKRSGEKLKIILFFLYLVPSFIIGLLLIYVFSVQLNIFPVAGLYSDNFSDLTFLQKLGDVFTHLVLPSLTLSIPGTAIFYNYLNENIEKVNKLNFIIYLRSLGVNEKTIFIKHIIPNAILPMISIAGIELGYLLGGSVITEQVFNIPGFGKMFIEAINLKDYPLITGCALLTGCLMILSNYSADLIKFGLNKRSLLID